MALTTAAMRNTCATFMTHASRVDVKRESKVSVQLDLSTVRSSGIKAV